MDTKVIRTISNLKWYYGGTLVNPKYVHGGGVYLLVHGGKRNRIIYVGTTLNFEKRWFEHSEGMKRGNRAIWKVNRNEDIYELMSYQGNKDYFKYYRKLALENQLWASTSVIKIKSNNDLNENDHFYLNWFEYTNNVYMPNIQLWGCRMNERLEYSTLLESQIQRALRSNFRIGSHINKPSMSWLGKIEHTHQDLFTFHFNFSSYPVIDDDSLSLLKNLTDKRIIKYQKETHPPRKKQDSSVLNRSSLKEIRKKYSQAYYRWDPIEDKILQFLIEKQISIDEMVKYLKRTPAEIEKRIEKIKRNFSSH